MLLGLITLVLAVIIAKMHGDVIQLRQRVQRLEEGRDSAANAPIETVAQPHARDPGDGARRTPRGRGASRRAGPARARDRARGRAGA